MKFGLYSYALLALIAASAHAADQAYPAIDPASGRDAVPITSRAMEQAHQTTAMVQEAIQVSATGRTTFAIPQPIKPDDWTVLSDTRVFNCHFDGDTHPSVHSCVLDGLPPLGNFSRAGKDDGGNLIQDSAGHLHRQRKVVGGMYVIRNAKAAVCVRSDWRITQGFDVDSYGSGLQVPVINIHRTTFAFACDAQGYIPAPSTP